MQYSKRTYLLFIVTSLAIMSASCKAWKKSYRGYLHGSVQYDAKSDSEIRRRLDVINKKSVRSQVCNFPVVGEDQLEVFYTTYYSHYFRLPGLGTQPGNMLSVDSSAGSKMLPGNKHALQAPNYKVIFDCKESYQLSTIEKLAADINTDLKKSHKGCHSIKVATVYYSEWMVFYHLTLLNMLKVHKDLKVTIEYGPDTMYTITYFMKRR